MSTGIGNHKYSTEQSSAYDEALAICPYCGYQFCSADWADVGVGLVQCGPFFCPECGASERSYLDTRRPTQKEDETGWYEPRTPPSEMANTVGGKLVNHKVAKVAFGLGLLDPNPKERV